MPKPPLQAEIELQHVYALLDSIDESYQPHKDHLRRLRTLAEEHDRAGGEAKFTVVLHRS